MADPMTWSRLEPITRDKGLAAGLEARTHDPLWLLGRQWQLGELTADGDRGSAVAVDLSAQVAPLSGYRAGPRGGPSVSYDPAAAPLEAVVEAEPVRSAPTLRLRADAGAYFLRLLGIHGVGRYADAYRTHYALASPPATDGDAAVRFAAVVTGRLPDGARLDVDLRSALRPSGGTATGLPAEPAIAPDDVDAVRAAAEAWLTWYDELFTEPPRPSQQDAWIPQRMEYTFGVAAAAVGGGVALDAGEYTDGRLDWDAFDATRGDAQPGNSLADGANTVGPLTMVPAPVTYPGMPSSRLWELEDAHVDFGGVEAQPEDIARMLLVEFALVFGGDWLVVPLEVSVGALTTIASLDVRDTFGRTQRVAATSTLEGTVGGWRMFTLSGDAGVIAGAGGDPLLVAPVLAASLHGRDLEEVLLLRDETANLAWAVERQVEASDGEAMDRAQVAYARRGAPPANPPTGGATFSYRLATEVPEHWLPLVPQRLRSEDPSIELRLGSLPATLPDGTPGHTRPLGRILAGLGGEDDPVLLREEEVPREGARITRSFQLARWTDGSTHLWVGRRKVVGRGEGSGGLRYDVMDDGTAG